MMFTTETGNKALKRALFYFLVLSAVALTTSFLRAGDGPQNAGRSGTEVVAE